MAVQIVKRREPPMTWMERLRRVFAIDLSICPDCGGRLRVIADVTRPDAIREILQHVARQQAPPGFSAISSMAGALTLWGSRVQRTPGNCLI
jgi:hypothetical protein